jgi:hypothetical protein
MLVKTLSIVPLWICPQVFSTRPVFNMLWDVGVGGDNHLINLCTSIY